MNCAEYIAERISEEGIDYVFGYQGGSISDVIEAVSIHEKLQYVQPYHEQGACFEAGAYARVSGKLGVCLLTNGPGLTNAVSAITDAYCDFVPLLVISGQVKTTDCNRNPDVRQNAFQEIDSEGLTSSITKYAHTIRCVEELEAELERAIQIAKEYPRGPVLLDIPLDIQKAEMGFAKEKKQKTIAAHTDNNWDTTRNQLEEIVTLLKMSKKPVIVAGGGIRQGDAFEELKRFAGLTSIPVVRTLAGLDLVADNDFGFSGLYGNVCANLALYHSDLLIVLGSRLAKRQVGIPTKYAPDAKVIHVDVNPAEFNHVLQVEIAVCDDIKHFLKKINAYISELRVGFRYDEWIKQLEAYKEKHQDDVEMNGCEELQPVTVLRFLSGALKRDAVVTLDVGQNQMWCAQGLIPGEQWRVLSSGGLGCMGFSLPSAIGAYYATGKPVYAFMGDGGSQMNIQELQSIGVNRLPVKVIIFNNDGLGMIQEVQMKFAGGRYFGSKEGYASLDYSKIATAYGVNYYACSSNDDIKDEKLQKLLNNNEPVIIELRLTGNPMRLLTMYDNIDTYQ